MEMMPMLTQPQDVPVPVPGTAGGNSIVTPSRISDTPALFATLLQEMLPASPENTAAAGSVINLTQSGKTILAGKDKAVPASADTPATGSTSAEECASGPVEARLSRLLILPGSIPAEHPVPTGKTVLSGKNTINATRVAAMPGGNNATATEPTGSVEDRLSRILALSGQLSADMPPTEDSLQEPVQKSESKKRKADMSPDTVKQDSRPPDAASPVVAFGILPASVAAVVIASDADSFSPAGENIIPVQQSVDTKPVRSSDGRSAGYYQAFAAPLGTSVIRERLQSAPENAGPAGNDAFPENRLTRGVTPENSIMPEQNRPSFSGRDDAPVDQPRRPLARAAVQADGVQQVQPEIPVEPVTAPVLRRKDAGRPQSREADSIEVQVPQEPVTGALPGAWKNTGPSPAADIPDTAPALHDAVVALSQSDQTASAGVQVPSPPGAVKAFSANNTAGPSLIVDIPVLATGSEQTGAVPSRNDETASAAVSMPQQQAAAAGPRLNVSGPGENKLSTYNDIKSQRRQVAAAPIDANTAADPSPVTEKTAASGLQPAVSGRTASEPSPSNDIEMQVKQPAAAPVTARKAADPSPVTEKTAASGLQPAVSGRTVSEPSPSNDIEMQVKQPAAAPVTARKAAEPSPVTEKTAASGLQPAVSGRTASEPSPSNDIEMQVKQPAAAPVTARKAADPSPVTENNTADTPRPSVTGRTANELSTYNYIGIPVKQAVAAPVRATTAAEPPPAADTPIPMPASRSQRSVRSENGHTESAAVQADPSQTARTATDARPAPEPFLQTGPREIPAEVAVAGIPHPAHGVLNATGRKIAREQVEAPVPQPAGDVSANRNELPVEVVFLDPSARDKAFTGREEQHRGAKEQDFSGIAGAGATAARSVDHPGPSRFTLPPKAEESGQALHESILNQVRSSVVSHDSKGNGVITVRLSPDNLGELQINVRVENQRVKVEIITENRTVRDALMGNLDNLKETFLKQNLDMERFDVSTGGRNGFGQSFRDERGEQRYSSPLPYSHEAVSFDTAREHGADDWGVTENSLVNLRL